MLDINELDLSESFSTDTSDLWKDNLDYVELESLDGELWNNRVIIELSSVMHDKVKTKTGIELFVDNRLPDRSACSKKRKDSQAA